MAEQLKQGSTLLWYEIKSVLGRGGFGITYLASDTNLHTKVAIKEYLPGEIAERTDNSYLVPKTGTDGQMYRWGLTRFIEEARILAKFNHPNIVRVLSVFEENNTAYMIMEYEQGNNLELMLHTPNYQTESRLIEIFDAILSGLEQVHAHNIIHRDIKPANIYIRGDGSPVLLDFGSARRHVEGQSQNMTRILTRGYAPYEQIDESAGEQGPWTDIYAIGATLYYAINNYNLPSDSLLRFTKIMQEIPDPIQSTFQLPNAGEYSKKFLSAIDQALKFKASERPQTAAEFRKLLAPGDNVVKRSKQDTDNIENDSDKTVIAQTPYSNNFNVVSNNKTSYGSEVDVSGPISSGNQGPTSHRTVGGVSENNYHLKESENLPGSSKIVIRGGVALVLMALAGGYYFMNSGNTEVEQDLISTPSIKSQAASAEQNVARLKQQRIAQERANRTERERLAREELERIRQERIAEVEADRAEQERVAKVKAEQLLQERIAQEKADRLERERKAREEAKKLEQERLAQAQVDRLRRERLARVAAQLEQNRLAQEKADKLERERLAKQEAERLEQNRIAQEKADKLEKERLAKLEVERLEQLRIAQERADQLEQKRIEQEKVDLLERERLAKLEADRLEQLRIAQEKADQLERKRLAKLAADQKEQNRLAVERKKRIEQEKRLAELERIEAEEIKRLKVLQQEEEAAKEKTRLLALKKKEEEKQKADLKKKQTAKKISVAKSTQPSIKKKKVKPKKNVTKLSKTELAERSRQDKESDIQTVSRLFNNFRSDMASCSLESISKSTTTKNNDLSFVTNLCNAYVNMEIKIKNFSSNIKRGTARANLVINKLKNSSGDTVIPSKSWNTFSIKSHKSNGHWEKVEWNRD